MGFKIYRIYRSVSNKKAAVEIVEDLNKDSEVMWHLDEIDTETNKVVKLS